MIIIPDLRNFSLFLLQLGIDNNITLLTNYQILDRFVKMYLDRNI